MDDKTGPRPWALDERNCPADQAIRDANGRFVLDTGDFLEYLCANSRLIVDAVNNIESLRAVNRELVEALEEVVDSDMAQREEDEGRVSPILMTVRAAITKSKGEHHAD